MGRVLAERENRSISKTVPEQETHAVWTETPVRQARYQTESRKTRKEDARQDLADF